MAYLATVTLLIVGYVVAQDADCDYRQSIAPGQQYFIDNKYSPNRKCRYILVSSSGYNTRADCNISMPYTNGCTGDRFLVSRTGDPNLVGAESYCGTGILSVVSVNNTLALAIDGVQGGRVQATIYAQAAPTTPAPSQCICGVMKQNRIVGGQETRPNQFPMMGALVERSTGFVHCGTTLISEVHLLTAGHCVYNGTSKGPQNPATYVAVLNIHNIETERGTEYQIQSFKIHENFNPTTYNNDIALVYTVKKIELNGNVIPACLPFKYTSDQPTAGTVCTALGWGTVEPGGMLSATLRGVDLPVISQQQCARTEGNITNTQFCTYAPGKDACQYDSGGPLLCKDSNGYLYIHGIISNGFACASTRPGIYARVPALLRWIVNNARAEFCIKR